MKPYHLDTCTSIPSRSKNGGKVKRKDLRYLRYFIGPHGPQFTLSIDVRLGHVYPRIPMRMRTSSGQKERGELCFLSDVLRP